METQDLLKCCYCNWIGPESDMLVAAHPFVPNETVCGCPECKTIEGLMPVCDEPGCKRLATCGTSTEDGYRQTCGMHRPKDKK